MMLAALDAEGVKVVKAPDPGFEQREATGAAGLALGSLAFLLQAKDSPTVQRAVERVRARLPQMKANVEQTPDDDD